MMLANSRGIEQQMYHYAENPQKQKEKQVYR